MRNVIFNDADSCYDYLVRVANEWNGSDRGKTTSHRSKTRVFATLYTINPTGLVCDRTRAFPVDRRLQRWTDVRVYMLYSVLQPRSREDCMACLLTRRASRGVQDRVSERVVHRKCAQIVKILSGFSSVNIIKVRQMCQVEVSPSGAKVTDEYRYTDSTSHAVMESTRISFVFTFSHRFGFIIPILSALYCFRIEGAYTYSKN